MDLLLKMVEHHIWLTGEMVSVRLAADRRPARRADRGQRRRRPPDDPLAAVPAGRPDGDVERGGREPRLRLVAVEEHESIDSLRTRLAEEGTTYLAHVREVCEQGRLDDTFVDALCEPAEVFTYGGMVAHVLTFAAHRRCLVVMALDKHGVPELGWGDPMRWVAS